MRKKQLKERNSNEKRTEKGERYAKAVIEKQLKERNSNENVVEKGQRKERDMQT